MSQVMKLVPTVKGQKSRNGIALDGRLRGKKLHKLKSQNPFFKIFLREISACMFINEPISCFCWNITCTRSQNFDNLICRFLREIQYYRQAPIPSWPPPPCWRTRTARTYSGWSSPTRSRSASKLRTIPFFPCIFCKKKVGSHTSYRKRSNFICLFHVFFSGMHKSWISPIFLFKK